jgi:hypothetical protein
MKTSLSTLIFSALLWASPVLAQGQPITHPAGFSTSAPADFQLTHDATKAVAVNAQKTIMVVVTNHNYSNFESFCAGAQLAKDGFAVVGEVRNLNATDRSFRAARPTETGYVLADTFVSFSPYGGGSLIVAISDERNADAAYLTAHQMASQLSFSRPQIDTLWNQALSGKHLVYLYTGNGYSERQDLFLHSNGTFQRRNDASSASQNGTGALAGGAQGTWQILSGGQLVLRGQDGSLSQVQLSQGNASNEIRLNGRRFFVLNS